MDGGRSFRGWMAATTVALTLTLVLLAVEKHIRVPAMSFFKSRGTSEHIAATTAYRHIQLSIDPGLAGIEHVPPTDRTPISRKSQSPSVTTHVSGMLRRPPEPVASAILQAPVALDQFTELPLHGNGSRLDQLLEVMELAFQSQVQTVSVQLSQASVSTSHIYSDRLAAVPAPASVEGRLPQPKRLYLDLSKLRHMLEPTYYASTADHATQPVSRLRAVNVRPEEAQQLAHWIEQTQALLDRVVVQHGLHNGASLSDLEHLGNLASQAAQVGDTLADHNLARQLLSTAYGLQRRVVVWKAISGCLAGASTTRSEARDPAFARDELRATILAVQRKLNETGDRPAWSDYLMLDDLINWVNSPVDIWSEGNTLALTVLSRLHWQRLSESQKRFLAQPEFEDLASHLLVWGRDAVDYHQLLTALETLEEDPISRVAGSVASAVQILRLSQETQQKVVAQSLNDHYRNANIRLAISEEIIKRVLPQNEVATRPVRQRILGADTAGDSSVRTELKIQLIPDASAWNLGVGVFGDMVSLTRSSKGPAVFHNTSTAQIDARRFVRLDPTGYQVTSEPTSVMSQDYLRKMSTDFDGLPILGDLARILAREQFDQKRGLAQRITRRIIANEADAELDRKLEESLANAEREIQKRLVGPLERLNLNPLIVSMSTSQDRLSIRYRVANEQQMAANTPRPRAPTDSLLSMQIHQSAINNTIAQIGLGGRTWTLGELYARLGEVFQDSKWELPADVPEDITIRFADGRPATVEMMEGRLRLTLRIAELRQGEHLFIERFIVSSNYIPAAEGLTAELIRDGVVEIISNHDRLKLRIIFAKVFVSNPQIPLIADSWAMDPRSSGLAVSQVEIRDGWLSVAVSKADSQQAAEVASRAQQLRLLK